MPNPARRVLVVSPHFSPVNAPDMQRTRLALPYLREAGWEPVVLAVAPEMVEGAVIEPLLERTYPSDIRVVRTRGIPHGATRWAGIGSLWLRCGAAIRAAGEALLAAEKFDLVLFSTTQFDAFKLGPRWRARFGVPYVLDYQDPWINDYYRRTATRPPGGWLKYGFSQWRARRSEPRALRGAAGVVCVSGAYGETFAGRYRWFRAADAAVIPFGAAQQDFATALGHRPADPLVDFGDGMTHLVYTGRCGPDMSTSLSILFGAFKDFLEARPGEARSVRFHFIGTDYAPRPLGRDWAVPIAERFGVEGFVREHCYRIPYFDALYYLTRAQALVCMGSNDPTYSASKIFPYVLAARPMLIVFHSRSPVSAISQELNCGIRFGFDERTDLVRLQHDVAKAWFMDGGMRRYEAPPEGALRQYTAEGMTAELARLFDAAVERNAVPR
jgi:hypothetical protein